MSLYRKYFFPTAAVMLLVPGIFSWILFKFNSEHIYAADRQRVELIAEIVKNGMRDVMLEGGGEKEFQRFLDRIAARDVQAVRLFSEEGKILNSTAPGERGKRADERYLKMFRSLQGQSFFTHEHDGSGAYSGVASISDDLSCRKCHSGSEKISVILGFEISSDTVDRSLSRLKTLAVCFYFIGALLFLVPFFLTGRYLVKRPLDALLHFLRDAGKGGTPSKMSPGGTGQMGEVYEGINRLAAELGRCRDEIQQLRGDGAGREEKMASIGEVTAIFAHEIKNPLAGISGALQVMAEDIPDDSPRRQICREMLDEIERLDTGVKDLLAYAKTPEPHLILTDINAMIERACTAERPGAGSSDVEIKTVLEAVPEAMIDQEQMGKVFMSMIRNAIDRMPGGGTLTVTTQYRKDRGEIEIAFLDTGREIPEEKIRDVFRPFFSTKQLGKGLKMAINRNIIENHKGTMKAMNRAGAGSAFSIIIPRKG
ncbi:MAG: ATP-binding protein [Nitrospirota bacterium]|nr:ATP-binding protein [Nitrospirota bacterium]